MKKLLLLFGMTLTLLTCGDTTTTTQTSPNLPKAIKSPIIDEDELVARLSMDFSASPTTQPEKDNNEIINFAIDELINLSRTESGLFFVIKKKGIGEVVKWGDKINMHYRGKLMDGTVFDNSYKRNQPLNIYVGNMVMGLNEGLQLLSPGAEATFYVPSHLGYGTEGLKNSKGVTIVPEDAILVFDVILLGRE